MPLEDVLTVTIHVTRRTKRIDLADARPGTYVVVLEWEPPGADVDHPYTVGWTVHRMNPMATETTLDDANSEVVVQGTCKSDGCADAQFHYGYTHVCGPEDLRDLLAAIQRAYVECAEITADHARDDCRAIGWAP